VRNRLTHADGADPGTAAFLVCKTRQRPQPLRHGARLVGRQGAELGADTRSLEDRHTLLGAWYGSVIALTMMLEPSLLAPVLSKPALPLNDPAGIEIAPEDIKAVRDRLGREDLTVMAYRFEGDRFCRAERFAAYAAALGDRFVGRVLPDSAANTDVAPFFARHVVCPHSVVTAHLIDEAGQPTIAARDEILSFFARRLVPPV
jgi:hypothetical protein